MPEIDISIVIVNYNVKDFLHKCLSSIQSSSGKLNIETIVVDNDSKDGSVEYLQPRFPEVKFIALKENIGFGKANNLGFNESSGKYILILNPDTILEERTLSVMFEYMKQNPETGIAGCKVLNPDGTFQLACRRGFPTPWAAFSKLFGLQKLFPKSKLFARYNQTFLPTDKTYNIDAVIGAFMFCRKEVIDELKGFDPDFFMYGEDIDLCFRADKLGWKVSYVHETSIVHYKGESTKRSSVNEVKHFYNAMEIFVQKHYSKSSVFLLILKIGIYLRQFFAYFEKFYKELLFILLDVAVINSALLISSKIWRNEYFAFPEYAYPVVFIVITLTLIISMLFTGEYLEKKHSIKKMFSGYLLTFFIISSLTYFFKEFAFSRGVVLLTIGISIVVSALLRVIISLYERSYGKFSDRKVLLVGTGDQAKYFIDSLPEYAGKNIDLVGVVSVGSYLEKHFQNQPIVGDFEYLPKLISEMRINDVVITDNSISYGDLLSKISDSSHTNTRFHFASEYNEFLASKIISDITGEILHDKEYDFFILKNRIFKRLSDIIGAILLMTVASPIIALWSRNSAEAFKNLTMVLKGKKSLIGLYVRANRKNHVGKQGLISLAHISNPERLTEQAIENLNDYYLKNYTLGLDLDIVIKYLFRKRRGK